MLVKMIRDGHQVDVHPTMVQDYYAAGYREVEPAEDQPKRGRKPKAAD